DGGYRTALMGKYLNNYPGEQPDTYVPPRWDEWDVPSQGNMYVMYDYGLNENSHVVQHGHEPRDYLTSVLDDKATPFVKRAARDDQPFFLMITPTAPHLPSTPPPDHQREFANVHAPRGPAFDEVDVADKPAWLQAFPRLRPRQIDRIDTVYRKRLPTMLGVRD